MKNKTNKDKTKPFDFILFIEILHNLDISPKCGVIIVSCGM